ncbi:DUF2231 domain-containing protein [Aquisalimonas sp.]|uniref:DUF2231 domain-containing protein n=1 Tax=Aquisalimonas sp. TaxID=1872621 RepID=UPI0025C5B913|nr:DUF2231 domain-containing protein [Aquisalimonas sp.]
MLGALPNWHPIFVHFTVALLTVAVLLFIVAHFSPPGAFGRTVRLVARVNLMLGALFTIGTVLTGWYAYNTVPHDAASHEVMTIHRNWALIAAATFALLALWCVRNWLSNRREGTAFVLATLLAATPLVMAGHYGGTLVYGYGVGVQQLPDTEGHAHNDHGHGHDHGDDDHGHNDDHHEGHGDGEDHNHHEH